MIPLQLIPLQFKALAVGVLGAGLIWGAFAWRSSVYSKGYDAGEADTVKTYEAAVAVAQKQYDAHVAQLEAALADARGKTVEVIKWRTRTETIYQEAVKNDADCKAWAGTAIACRLGGLQDGAGTDPGAAVPADPGEPAG
jgi:hypothetical protein